MDRKGQPSFVEDVHRLQVIKCVLVGDRAVGKSRLVCAKMNGTKYTLRELVQMHISTVCAVDQYRTNADVQRRSICTVECVTCSLRLWDTFGNHEKDRQFAYSSADVVLACFSVADRRSLKHIETHWMPEILRMCGSHVPVILCACKIDMRYLYNDPSYTDLARAVSHQKLCSEDIVLPDEAKTVAKKLGIYYYETSILAQYGIDEVFSNCVRAALISKRRGKILVSLGNLKNVVRPHLQVPHMPPRPSPPKVVPYQGNDITKLDATMIENSEFTDVVFVAQGKEISAHSIFLIAASAAFQSFLEEMFGVESKSSSVLNLGSSLSCSQVTLTRNDSIPQMDFDLRNLELSDLNSHIDQNSEHDTGISYGGCSSRLSQVSDKLSRDDYTSAGQFNRQRSVSARQYPAQNLKSLSEASWISTGRLQDCDVVSTPTNSGLDSGFNIHTQTTSSSCLSSVLSCHSTENGKNHGRVMIAVDESVSPAQFRTVLRYLYTGELTEDLSFDAFLDLKRVAQLLSLDDLDRLIINVLNKEPFLNLEIKRKFELEKSEQLSTHFFGHNYFSDVTIEVDDGSIPGHLALLSARCEVLLTMFTSEFSERSTGRVKFPDVSRDAFLGVLEYLYTGKCPAKCKDWGGLLELCDRFLLRDLLLSAEVVVIRELMASMEAGLDVVELSLALLEPAKLHGAKQLTEHCTWILKVNYKDLIEHNASALEAFDLDLQTELARDRWPPLWYLKEVEIYEKAILEMNKLRPQQSWLRRSDGEACISPGSCLSFWKRKR